MIVVDVLWQRHRWTLIFVALALGLGTAVGATAQLMVALRGPAGSRSTFYVELFLAGVGGLLLVSLLLSRARAGLPVLVGVLAFLPSRTGMQWQALGPIFITVVDLLVLLGLIVLVLQTKILHKERLKPVIIHTPLWIWLGVGLLGLIVAVARNVPWVNYVAEIKGFYLYILIPILCVNVIRTRLTLHMIMLVAVLSAIPDVYFQLRDTATGNATVQTALNNGVVVDRTSGGAGAINQYACYIMLVFFIALALGMTSRRWVVRLFYFGCAAYFLVGIGLTYTRGAYIATLVGLVVLGVVGGWRVLASLVAASIGAYFLVPSIIWQRLNFNDNSTAERVNYISTATAVVRAYPWLGGGWGSNFTLVAQYVMPDTTAGSLPFWHNDYLIVATQVGLPGLAVFLWIWLALLWTSMHAYRRAPRGALRTYLLVLLSAVVAMCVQAATEMLVWNVETGPMLWLIVGLICAIINMMREEKRIAQPMIRPAVLS